MTARLLLIACFLLTVARSAAGTRTTDVDAIFVVIADQHSAYARTAQFVAKIDRLKADNPGIPLVVLIDGDTFELGNVIAKRSGGAIEFAMFRALARRARTVLNLGNHEPEFYDLAETVARVRATGVTVIGNLVNRATGKLFAPSSTHLKLGERDAVIAGLTTDMLAQYRAAVRPTLDLANPVVWAKAHLPALLATAPVKIVLSHAGLKYDREIFSVVPDGTLFAGAHDHELFVHGMGRTVYFHSGSWNGHLSVARLRHEAGQPVWDVEQIRIGDDAPADSELAKIISSTQAKFATPEDLATIGHLNAALTRTDAARMVVRAARKACGADAAFIGNTTFGDGLPTGNVSRMALDACVRFDGTLCVAEVSGTQLRAWLATSNQGPETAFELRRDESLVADGPAAIDPEKIYRIATTDWGVRNRARYFGSEALVFVEQPELRLKAVVTQALNSP